MRLPDGRYMGYRESGDPRGTPLFYFHGLPGSRFQCPDEGTARDLGVRLIAPERPGYGLSDPMSGPYPPALWAHDVTAMADALGIGQFSVAGFSVGGMYALVCAHELPQRVLRLGLVCSIAPLEVPGNWEGMGNMRLFYELARTDPAGLRLAAESAAASPEIFSAAVIANCCEADRRLGATPAMHERALRDARETLRHGLDAALRDLTLCAHPWGVDLTRIGAAAQLWHGLDDVSAPPAMARYLAATLPDCQARLYPGEGHLLLFTRWPEILAALAV